MGTNGQQMSRGSKTARELKFGGLFREFWRRKLGSGRQLVRWNDTGRWLVDPGLGKNPRDLDGKVLICTWMGPSQDWRLIGAQDFVVGRKISLLSLWIGSGTSLGPDVALKLSFRWFLISVGFLCVSAALIGSRAIAGRNARRWLAGREKWVNWNHSQFRTQKFEKLTLRGPSVELRD